MTSRDEEFAAYVQSSYGWLCRSGYLLCGDWHRAEDAAQETLLRLGRRWTRVSPSSMDAYARRSLVNILIDESRRPWRRFSVRDEVPDQPMPDAADAVAARADVTRALATLTPRQRAVIVLRYYADASVADTADALGCSEGNVKRLTSDALAALRSALVPELEASEIP